jgi:hypothetical protein
MVILFGLHSSPFMEVAAPRSVEKGETTTTTTNDESHVVTSNTYHAHPLINR